MLSDIDQDLIQRLFKVKEQFSTIEPRLVTFALLTECEAVAIKFLRENNIPQTVRYRTYRERFEHILAVVSFIIVLRKKAVINLPLEYFTNIVELARLVTQISKWIEDDKAFGGKGNICQ